MRSAREVVRSRPSAPNQPAARLCWSVFDQADL